MQMYESETVDLIKNYKLLQTEFNTLLDFDEADENEVSCVISAQVYSGKFNSSIT